MWIIPISPLLLVFGLQGRISYISIFCECETNTGSIKIIHEHHECGDYKSKRFEIIHVCKDFWEEKKWLTSLNIIFICKIVKWIPQAVIIIVYFFSLSPYFLCNFSRFNKHEIHIFFVAVNRFSIIAWHSVIKTNLEIECNVYFTELIYVAPATECDWWKTIYSSK